MQKIKGGDTTADAKKALDAFIYSTTTSTKKK